MTTQHDWRDCAQELSDTVDQLADICRDLIQRLSEYEDVEAEERRLEEITKEDA